MRIIDYSPDCLVHYGIKGQKWGIRRYQNPDGTLTESGRKRYARIEIRNAKKAAKRQKKAEARKAKILNNPILLRKHMNEFSDAEIERALSDFNRKRRVEDASRQYVSIPVRDAAAVVGYGAAAVGAYETYKKLDSIIAAYNKKGG